MKLICLLNLLECKTWSSSDGTLAGTEVLVYNPSTKTPKGCRATCLVSEDELRRGKMKTGEAIPVSSDVVLLVWCRDSANVAPATSGDAPRVVAFTTDMPYAEARQVIDELDIYEFELNTKMTQVFEAFSSAAGIRQFANKLSSIVGNPLVITNTDDRIIATAGEFPKGVGEIDSSLASGYVSEAAVEHLEEDQILEHVRQSRRPILRENRRIGKRWCSAILYFKRLEVGRIEVLETDVTLTAIDVEVIDYASTLLGTIVAREGVGGQKGGGGSSMLYDMLTDKGGDEETRRHRLVMSRVPLDETYVLAVCHGNESLAAVDYRTHLAELVTRYLRGAVWTMDGNSFVFLVSVGRLPEGSFDEYALAKGFFEQGAKFESKARNNEIRCYVSEPFTLLSFAPERYRQCKDLETTLKDSPDAQALSYYWEHRFEVLASTANPSNEADRMLDKRVVAMYRFDLKHGTQYFNTCVVSVNNPGAPGKAADELCVHRNTYFYRTKKVNELFGLDLKEGEDRLAVAFSERVMRGLQAFRAVV